MDECINQNENKKANDTFLFCLYLKNLFTNVHLKEVIDNCADTLNTSVIFLFSFLLD